jgi:formylglycine-generating enzyme required for sulfatase activity
MKNIICYSRVFIVLIFLHINTAFSQDKSGVQKYKKPKYAGLKGKMTKEMWMLSGTPQYVWELPDIKESFIQILPNVYACQREVTNYDYSKFINYLRSKNKDSTKYYLQKKKLWEEYKFNLKNYPDSNLVNMDEYYSIHPVFDGFPVVGLSLEIMEEYCAWLTENSKLNTKKKKVVYRLPSYQEWQIALSNRRIEYSKDEYCDSVPDCNIKSYSTCAYKKYRADEKNRMDKDNIDSTFAKYYIDGFMFTAPVCQFPPNNIFLYGMIGNVSEVVKINGEYKTTGGDWDAFPDDCNRVLDFIANQPTIGFRVFMEVIEP